MSMLIDVLRDIKSGATVFRPTSDKDSDMLDFQGVAKALDHANNEGLLDGYLPHRESRTGHRWYNLVIVRNGLSHKGDSFLKDSEQTMPLEDRPNGSDKIAVIARLSHLIERGNNLIEKSDFRPGLVRIWISQARSEISSVFGSNSNGEWHWSPNEIPEKELAAPILIAYVQRLKLLHDELLEVKKRALSSSTSHKIFIGHGRANDWRELKDYLKDDLGLSCIEFNGEPVAGKSTATRLSEMLNESTFALLIMTAEDEHADLTVHARANVIHEIGLFQGRLGPMRAIVLREESCETFSNIHGVTDIPFKTKMISSTFYKIHQVLVREGIIETTRPARSM